MNNRERVVASLAHRQPDKIPYHVGFTQPAYSKMAAYYGNPGFVDELGNCFTVLRTEAPGAWQEVAPNLWRDQFGVQWDRSVDKDIGVVANQLVTPDTLDCFEFPDPLDPARYSNYPQEGSVSADAFYVAEIGFSLFERAWTLTGMENLFMAMRADPSFAHALLDRILDFNLAVIERACSFAIDAMYFGDDWGQQRGLLMGRDLWDEFIGPRVRTMYQAVKARGKYVIIHSCGKVDELFPALIEAGVDVFNPFQPEVIDVFAAKRDFGARLCFHGGISTQQTLPYASPERVREEVRRLLDEVGRNGGYFAAPAHAIPADAKEENIAAMLEVLKSQ